MAWSAPITATTNMTFNASQFNATVRDNLAETMPAKAANVGRWFVGTAANALTERVISENTVLTEQSTTSTTYTNLTTTGPAVTVTTGTFAIVSISALAYHGTANAQCWMSFEVTGASSVAASDDRAILWDGGAAGSGNQESYGISHGVTLTGGSNTVTAKYRTNTGTATFLGRKLTVWSF